MEYDNILQDGKLTSRELESYLKVYSIQDLVELYQYSSRVCAYTGAFIDKLEDIKGKYDVCASDEFFQVLLNAEKIYELASYITRYLSPVIIKDFDADLFVEIEKNLKDILTLKDQRLNQMFYIPLTSSKVRAFPYNGNLGLFLEFLEEHPGVMVDYFHKNPKALKELLQKKREKRDTISHEETLGVSDLVFYMFYKSTADRPEKKYRELKQSNFMDFRDRAMSYFTDEDGYVDHLEFPYDTSCLQPLPSELLQGLKKEEDQSWELLRYLEEEARKVKSEMQNYGNLVMGKYGLPLINANQSSHKKSTF